MSDSLPSTPYDGYDPKVHGVSVSCMNLWLVDRSACGTRYIDNYQEVEAWRCETAFGKMVQAGIEGFIKIGTIAGLKKFIQNEYLQQVSEHGTLDLMIWWAHLALAQAETFVRTYADDPVIPLTALHTSERNIFQQVELPSGREFIMNCYLDGEFDGGLFENKVRGRYDPVRIAANIKYDLQYNWYLMAMYQETGTLPEKVWYQHQLRLCGKFSKGPRRKTKETDSAYLQRVTEYIQKSPSEVFYRFIGYPTEQEINLWAHATFYPMMEAFLDWYEYRTSPDPDLINKYDWVAPYGTYNPFEMDTNENYRNYRLTGNTVGLKKRN